MYPEELPLGHATPPAGNEETGPVKGGGEVSRGLKEGRKVAGSSEELWVREGEAPWWGRTGKGIFPAVSWMAGSMTQKSFDPEQTREGCKQDTAVTYIYIT